MSKPNILFILVDQMRADALGKATPNINALARRGVNFENCYTASPVCMPSRNSIITGKFSTMEGIIATETLIAFNTFSRHDLEHMFSIGE